MYDKVVKCMYTFRFFLITAPLAAKTPKYTILILLVTYVFEKSSHSHKYLSKQTVLNFKIK